MDSCGGNCWFPPNSHTLLFFSNKNSGFIGGLEASSILSNLPFIKIWPHITNKYKCVVFLWSQLKGSLFSQEALFVFIISVLVRFLLWWFYETNYLNAKYLNALQHSLSWFWISSLVGLAEQGCILGFGSGSGQLQFQAERKICCSHERAMELQAVLWKFATPLSASVQDPKDHFYPLPKELTWLSPKSMKRDIIFPSAMNHGRGGEVWKIIHQ